MVLEDQMMRVWTWRKEQEDVSYDSGDEKNQVRAEI